ncbi:metallophosphoesterase family protein [Rhodomicrobium lacus]|uniref:metallophosphoesterase family protein n=1 Tax=Rhodomicrobium TaxID=1068 RepID=UPI000F8DC6D4|nr:metallophosphoesterase family protein [Rhodomicrobium lacus]WKW49768.1 metallophosphoesterase family protein [Rhodomicrobium lacus]
MLIALLADIHANRQAFAACLDDAKARGAERHVLLGDFVGYGADPVWCVDKAMELVAGGAIAVLGNHDAAITEPSPRMNPEAQAAIDWTRGKLGQVERRWLAELPMERSDEGRLYVHADASQPSKWIYVLTVEEAARSLRSTQAPITFCGHTHKPAIFSTTAAAKMTAFSPVTEVAVPLHGLRRWLCVLGSVGQPRDGNPRACYGLFDTEKKEIVYIRVPYDIEAAAAAIRAARLPDFFAERLFIGR